MGQGHPPAAMPAHENVLLSRCGRPPDCVTLRERRAIQAEKARVTRRLKRGLPLWDTSRARQRNTRIFAASRHRKERVE